MLLLPMVASAGDVVEVDGIYYNLIEKSKEAEVTNNPNDNYRISVDIPAYFEYGGETYCVTSICSGAFGDCGELYSINIPNTVTSIGAKAFYDCEALKTIKLPDSITDVDPSAFQHCDRLIK